jgi:hypothetical protein
LEWLKGILEHLAVSRALVAAVFLTACTMLWGPAIAPEIVPASPDAWRPLLFGAMILSGCLLFFWGATGAWHFSAELWSSARAALAARHLTQSEVDLLAAMGDNPREPLRLNAIDYERLPLSRLEFLNVVRSLDHKGLVSMNPYASELVTLTRAGERRALEIHRASQSERAV